MWASLGSSSCLCPVGIRESQGWEFPWAQSPLGGSGGTRGDSGLVMRRSLTEMGLKQVGAPFGAPWSLLSWQELRCGPCSEVLPNHSSQQGNVSGAAAHAAFPVPSSVLLSGCSVHPLAESGVKGGPELPELCTGTGELLWHRNRKLSSCSLAGLSAMDCLVLLFQLSL